MSDLKQKIGEAVKAIGKVTLPEFAVILGTGLGAVAESIKKERSISYEDLPHFAKSTVASHKSVRPSSAARSVERST